METNIVKLLIIIIFYQLNTTLFDYGVPNSIDKNSVYYHARLVITDNNTCTSIVKPVI